MFELGQWKLLLQFIFGLKQQRGKKKKKQTNQLKQTKNPTLILKFYSSGHRTWPRMEGGEQKLFSRNRVMSYIFQSMLFWRGKVVTEKQLATWKSQQLGWEESIQEAVVSSLESKYNFMCFREIARWICEWRWRWSAWQ